MLAEASSVHTLNQFDAPRLNAHDRPVRDPLYSFNSLLGGA